MRSALLLPFLASCVFPATTVPIPVLDHPAPAGAACGLVVLLPGRGDALGAYERHGFVDRIQTINPHLDVVSVDAHLGYYLDTSITTRLHEDVLAPRAKRYEHVWLVGISLGGLGSIAYDIEHPGIVDGMLLLAPYLGDADVVAEVRAAGGPRSWTPPQAEGNAAWALYRRVWRWCRELHEDPASKPTVLLGYGDNDRFRRAAEMLAEGLPRDHWLTIPGDHNWRTWTPLFEQLASRAFAGLR